MPWTTPRGAGATVHIWNGYSMVERDRRWNAVRANAAQAGFDCILVPLGDGIDARYMTQLRCSAMVLAHRRPRADHHRRPAIEQRMGAQSMADRPRMGRADGRSAAGLGMQTARIGVAGLNGGPSRTAFDRRRRQSHALETT